MINHARTACVRIVDKDVSAGLDRCLDRFALFVYHITAAFENIPARIIRSVLANNESFERLIIRGRTFLWLRFDYCSGYGDCLLGRCCLFLMRLRKCQRRDEGAAGKSYNSFYHYGTSCWMLMGVILTRTGFAYRMPGSSRIHNSSDMKDLWQSHD